MFHRKRTIEPEAYPDNNHNGVPDAFEDRPPLAEVLGFAAPEPIKPSNVLTLAQNKPKPLSNYRPPLRQARRVLCRHGQEQESSCAKCSDYIAKLLGS